MPDLHAIASILWAKWGTTFLSDLRQEASDAADGLAFRAMNSQGGVRQLLVVCTTDRTQILSTKEALALTTVARPVDWESYSVAEMIFKTEKKGGFGQQEFQDGRGQAALLLCATRPQSVQALERFFDLPE